MIRYHVHIYAHNETNVVERDEGHHADGLYLDRTAAVTAARHALDETYVSEVRIIKEGDGA